jgi:hypothetical protein
MAEFVSWRIAFWCVLFSNSWLLEWLFLIQFVGLEAEPLVHPEPAGVIWTALVLDYPGHSFSHLGLFFGQYHTTSNL